MSTTENMPRRVPYVNSRKVLFHELHYIQYLGLLVPKGLELIHITVRSMEQNSRHFLATAVLNDQKTVGILLSRQRTPRANPPPGRSHIES